MTAEPLKVSESPSYWTHEVGKRDGPVAVSRMSQLIDYDDRLNEEARVSYRFLCNWYHKDYGDALLSMRHVARVMKSRVPAGAKCLSRSAVQRGISLLLDTGWVVRTFKGRGKDRQASRYIPVFNVLDLAAQGKFPELSRQPGHFSDCPEPRDTTGPNCGTLEAETDPNHGTKTLLLDPPTGGVTERENEPATPTAPTAVGLAATAAVSAGDERPNFMELWRGYNYPHGIKEARAAYAKLAPTPDRHADIVARATEWREAWAAQNKPDAARYTLANWLEREEYECAPPTGYKPKEKKAKKAKPKAADIGVAEADNDNDDDSDSIPDFMVGSATLWPVGEYVGQFIESDVQKAGGDIEVTLDFEVASPGEFFGNVFKHRFYSQAFMKGAQEEGQAYLLEISTALGLDGVEDTDELVFKPLVATANGRTIQYRRLQEAEAA